VENVPGSMEFDLTNWQLACQCIRQALDARLSAADIQSVACCSMREGIVLYDRNGEAIWACANVDARASREVAELKEIHDYRFESEVYDVSGPDAGAERHAAPAVAGAPSPGYLPQAATITMISDWLAAKLSGELAVDPSNAGTTGMLDLFSRDWRPALLDMAGLRADILSPVKETGTVLGAVTKSGAAERPARRHAGGDGRRRCAARLPGAGVVRAGQTRCWAAPSGNRWSTCRRCVPTADEYSREPARHSRHGAGGVDQLLYRPDHALVPRRLLRRRKADCRADGVDAYSLLEEMASRVPAGSHGVMPIFSDAMHFKQWYHAAPSFINLSIDPENATKRRCSARWKRTRRLSPPATWRRFPLFRRDVRQPGVCRRRLKRALWSQILSDVTGLPVRCRKCEATALGCAIAAGTGAGLYNDMASTGERLVSWHREFTPIRQHRELYRDDEKWQAVYADQLGWWTAG
jgi:autoinducer 2 (AI-2) kinase